tara:strand:+ start:200 stop:784 length:585 start_codon:yes stop_codon:yes gene_type:complete
MSDSTSISDLPTDPLGGAPVSNNISMTATENVVVSQNQQTSTLDENTISQIVSGLQNASLNGGTQLPSRDIPMNTNNITTDPNIQPNYVPPPQQNMDYIRNNEQTTDMVDDYNKNMRTTNSLDDMYNEIQVPLLLAVLYFLFQLPFFRKFLFSYFPILFSVDGNMNINGFLFTSILFGLLYYLLNKITNHFSAF